MDLKKKIKQIITMFIFSILILSTSVVLSSCAKKDVLPNNTGDNTANDSTNSNDKDAKDNTNDGSQQQNDNFNVDDVIRDGTFIGYINGIDTTTKTISFDDIEWLSFNDTERLKEIGVNPEDVLEYYIYNPNEENITYNYSEDLKIELLELLEGVKSTPKTLDEFVTALDANKILCNITILNSEIVQITEQYRP